MLKAFLLRFGLWGTVLLVTLLSVGMSALVSLTVNHGILHTDVSRNGWIVTVVAPLLIAPVMSYFTLRLVLQLEKLRGELQHAVHHDPLTALPNRRYFMARLHEQIAATATDRSQPFALALLDVDDFKAINDRHGHLGGDAVLRCVAEACQRSVRRGDVFARIGGEEFALLVRDADAQVARSCAERLLHAVRELRVPMPGGSVQVTVSIGLACFGAGNVSVDALFHRADQALYAAKRAGKNLLLTDPAQSLDGLPQPA